MAATARIDELRSKFDDNPRRYFASLANEYRKAGDLTTAIAICRTQLRHYPTHMSGHVVLGQALFESGELDAARIAFERAVELDPENLIALRHLGDAAMARNDIESARRWYRRVLDIDAGNDAIATQLLTLEAPPIRVVEPEPATPVAVPDPPPASLEPEPEREPTRATGIVDFDPDELAWPSPASPEIPAVSDEVPAFIEAADAAPSETDAAAGGLDFVDGWDTLDVADLSETVEVPVPARSGSDAGGSDAAGSDAEGGDATRPDEPDDPVVGLDLPPVDDAGLRELAHVTDDSALDLESVVVDEHPVDAAEPAVEATPEADRPLAESPAAAPAPIVPPVDAETAPLDEVIASGAFVTETMAELCVQQGHDDEALAIYEQLAAQRPDDARLAERLAAVRTRLGRPTPPDTSAPAGDFLRSLAERRPDEQPTQSERAPGEAGDEASAVSDLTLEYPTPMSNPAIEPQTVQPASAQPDERDRWAASAWRGAFRADAAPEQPLLAHLTPREPTPDLDFDRFFVGLEEEASNEEAPTSEPEARPPAPPAPAEPAVAQDADQDLAEFNAWLRGLRDA